MENYEHANRPRRKIFELILCFPWEAQHEQPHIYVIFIYKVQVKEVFEPVNDDDDDDDDNDNDGDDNDDDDEGDDDDDDDEEQWWWWWW